MNPITELRRFIQGSINRARSKRLFGELLGWEACEDIATDIVAHEEKQSRTAYSAAVEDEEAAKAIEAVTADGKVDRQEFLILAKAVRQIRSSAKRDRDISDAATL